MAEVIELALNGILSGVRSMYTDPDRGSNFTNQLLDPETNGQRIQNMTRMQLTTFVALIKWLKANTNLDDSDNSCQVSIILIEQKVLIFLYITTQGTAYRNAAEKFHHSLDTISKVFHEVLEACCLLYQKIVRIPGVEESEEFLKRNPKIWPFLKGCLEALDECHISIAVPSSQQSVWRN